MRVILGRSKSLIDGAGNSEVEPWGSSDQCDFIRQHSVQGHVLPSTRYGLELLPSQNSAMSAFACFRDSRD